MVDVCELENGHTGQPEEGAAQQNKVKTKQCWLSCLSESCEIIIDFKSLSFSVSSFALVKQVAH